ncbi:MAG: hypothetical protein JW941_08130 [Candidatus Coatesbacteria bacterium]|nr:hypothetical protein [Candidatus Coatesbacteria bacterium]
MMTYSFEQALNAFRSSEIRDLSLDPNGLRFLKLRSMSRTEYLHRLLQDNAMQIPKLRGDALMQFLFDADIAEERIESTMRAIYAEQRQARRLIEDEMVSELYRLEAFDWGGLHQNSLEKTIVDNYIKKIRSYDALSDCIENELHRSMRGYVLCSWYNHWTSIIIEDIFRDHSAVLPAIGLIKKVDFFISGTPFDLKVTYFPEGYVKDIRKKASLRPETTLLKSFCRSKRITFDSQLPESRLLEDLWKKVEDYPSSDARDLISSLRQKRLEMIADASSHPEDLMRWLYENQGERRFDASNRLFLILIDTHNFFESWRLKRAKHLLARGIHGHLNEAAGTPGRELEFVWKDRRYFTTSDAIFIIHDRNR